MLQIQIHVKMPKPGPGVRYSSQLLDEIAERWLKGKALPRRIQVTMLEWRWGRGEWRAATTAGAMRSARDDFRFITQSGPFEFTTRESV